MSRHGVPGNRCMRHAKMRGGVTLVELLIVVLILAALAAVAVPRISESATAARKRLCRTNIEVINTEIEEYRLNSGAYPDSLPEVTQNPNYFPDGAPICPITKQAYTISQAIYRVDTTEHNH